MSVLNRLKSWYAKTLGKSKSGGTDEDEVLVIGDEEETESEGEEESEVPIRTGQYDSEQIILTFRAKPGEEAINVDHDFTYIPTEREVEEEFGPGIYNIFVREEEGKRPKLKKRYKIEGHPILPVVKYEVKVRIHEGGDLLDTNVEFPGPRPPEKEEIINALGGGGLIKLNARDKDNRILWSEWYDFRDIEPSKSLVARDNSIKSKIEQEVEAKKKKVEDEILRRITEREDEKKSKFDETVDRLIETIEDTKLERLQEAIEAFGEKLNSSFSGKKQEPVGLSDLAFKEPYRIKLETQKAIIQNLAKKDPEEALRAIERMPDGISIGLQLGLAATGLIEALTDYLKEVGPKERKKGTEREKGVEKRKARKEREGKKEKSVKEEAETQAEKTVEQEEPKINVEEVGDESGIEFIFSPRGGGDEIEEVEKE